MKLFSVPLLLLTISIIIGILLEYYFQLDRKCITFFFFSSVISLFIYWFFTKKLYHKGFIFSLLSIIVFVLFGMILVHLHQPKNYENHYTHHIPTLDISNDLLGLQFTIKERLKPTDYYHKYVVTAFMLQNKRAEGTWLLKMPKDSITKRLQVGDVYNTYATLRSIPKPLNPAQFDYSKYLSYQYIFHQIVVPRTLLVKKNTEKWSFYRIADQIRIKINQKLSLYDFNTKQIAIINALLLGQRQDIDSNTLADYRDAGAVHLLAISGLHVGIILMIFNFLLKPLEFLGQNTKILKTILLIILIWCFTIIAGLTPSVLRAATMFTFLTIGLHIRSKTSIYNTLLISIFILLICNPLLLFSIGFQLSYLAVFAIVWIQPILVSYYEPRFLFDKVLWETTTVTLAAQFGLLPLTIFYFHQFPLLFFMANIAIIPVLGIVLGLGLIVMMMAYIGFLPNIMVSVFGGCIDIINYIIHWVASQKSFLITDISFSWRMVAISFIMIISFISLFKRTTLRKIQFSAILLIVFCTILIFEKIMFQSEEQLVIFHQPRNTVIGTLKNQQLNIYRQHLISEKSKNFILDAYLIKNNAHWNVSKKLKNMYRYKDKTIVVIDSFGIFNVPKILPDILLISGSPKIHLDRILDSLKVEQVVTDGNNYRSYVDRWEQSCRLRNILFHRTDTDGAFIIDEN